MPIKPLKAQHINVIGLEVSRRPLDKYMHRGGRFPVDELVIHTMVVDMDGTIASFTISEEDYDMLEPGDHLRMSLHRVTDD